MQLDRPNHIPFFIIRLNMCTIVISRIISWYEKEGYVEGKLHRKLQLIERGVTQVDGKPYVLTVWINMKKRRLLNEFKESIFKD